MKRSTEKAWSKRPRTGRFQDFRRFIYFNVFFTWIPTEFTARWRRILSTCSIFFVKMLSINYYFRLLLIINYYDLLLHTISLASSLIPRSANLFHFL